MTEDETIPDVEGAVREFLRASPAVSSLVSNRVFLRAPNQPYFPLVTVRRIGGGDDTSEAPIDQALVQIDVWGGTRSEGGSIIGTSAVRLAVRKAMRTVREPAVTSAGVLRGAVLESDLPLEDPDNGRPRYVLTYLVTATAA